MLLLSEIDDKYEVTVKNILDLKRQIDELDDDDDASSLTREMHAQFANIIEESRKQQS